MEWKRIRAAVAILLLAALLLGSAGCSGAAEGSTAPLTAARLPTDAPASLEEMAAAVRARGGYRLAAAVLFAGAPGSAVETTLDYLRQSLLPGLEAAAVDAAEISDLSGYDMVCLDESLRALSEAEGWRDALLRFVEDGGGVLVPNSLYDLFPAEFFGAASFAPLESLPEALTQPEAGADLLPLQELISDFHRIYLDYQDAEELLRRDYGCAMRCAGAVPLVCDASGTLALYAMHRYGRGYVFFTNPLLPNRESAGAFSLAAEEGQTPFSNTTASCNQLLLNRFAAFLSLQIYGFSAERVFGAYGSPAMSWELHYEDITAIEHDSLGRFSQICEEHLQPVSLTLIRSTYAWFEQAETMTYALNRGGPGALDFALDWDESAYSSGTHIACGDRWLRLNALEDCGSYFQSIPEENDRLYPCVLDYDGDGCPDAFCGSADGKVYYFHGQGLSGSDGRLVMDAPVELENVSVPGFSAPQCLDMDGDGDLDLLVGAGDGLLRLFENEDGALRFSEGRVLLNTDIRGQCLPSAGDVDGDGVPDLAVGSDRGILLFYYGSRDESGLRFSTDHMSAISRQCADEGLGAWLSPHLADWNGDGLEDLLVGVFDGYVALLAGRGDGSFAFSGYIGCNDVNYKGNTNLKFGTYCTPVLWDLNGDGAQDLLCGCEEYGLAVSIDSDYFPYREELEAQLALARSKHWYVGLHYLSGIGHSAERELWELDRQRKALASYGLTELQGLNQHTWHLSQADPLQSLRCMALSGFRWQSGYEPSGALWRAPESAAENSIVLPFYFRTEGAAPLLVENCSVLLHRGSEWSDYHGKYGMPVLAYYHCDMIYKQEDDALRAAEEFNAFRERFSYNVVKEDQLMYGIAAAYNLSLQIEAEDGGLVLTPGAVSTELPLYDEAFQSACGVRLRFAEGAGAEIGTDARVWYRSGDSLFLGLDGPVRLRAGAAQETAHLRQVNLPAEIRPTEDGVELRFLGDGYLEAVVEGKAAGGAGWTVTERDGKTVFSRFGSMETLRIRFSEKEG